MRTFIKALLAIALVLSLASTIAASSQTRVNEPADAIGWFGLYGMSDESAAPTMPFLSLPECSRCGRDVTHY